MVDTQPQIAVLHLSHFHKPLCLYVIPFNARHFDCVDGSIQEMISEKLFNFLNDGSIADISNRS